MKVWIAGIVALACFIIVLLIRAALCKWKGRKLTSKSVSASATDQGYYCRRLAKMISCRTVSVKDVFEPEEFYKLRSVLQELFPLVTEKAEIRYFGEDCYCYKLSGKNTERNVMLMSHHDVAAVEGEWKYSPFSGSIAEGCVWGRGTVDTKTARHLL